MTRLAVRLHRRFRFDAIFSSGMPFSDHVIALVVHRLLRRLLGYLLPFVVVSDLRTILGSRLG